MKVPLAGALSVGSALVRRPRLWPTAVATGVSLVPRQWWRHRPFLPVPDRRWLRFRLITAYGGEGKGPMQPRDVITWLEWKKTIPRA